MSLHVCSSMVCSIQSRSAEDAVLGVLWHLPKVLCSSWNACVTTCGAQPAG